MSISNGKPHYGNLSPEFAVLGLLYGGPLHGYDLHRKLLADLGQVWHLSQSQAYAILKRLEKQGDVAGEQIPQDKLPPKQLLHITPAGRRHFMDWMGTPAGGSIRAIRMEFLTRLYFSSLYDPANIRGLFQAQRLETEKQIKRLEAAMQDLPTGQLFNRLSLEMRLRQLRLVIEWMDDCRTSFIDTATSGPPAR